MATCFTTITPFAPTYFRVVIEYIATSIAEFHLSPRPLDWAEPEGVSLVDNAYQKMASHVLTFLKRESVAESVIESLLDDPNLSKYHFRYFNPYAARDFISMNVKGKKRRASLLSAYDCFFEVARRASCSVADLSPIANLSQSLLRGDREGGVLLLLALAMHHSSARELVVGLLDSPKAEIRFTVISFFGFYHLPYPEGFVLNVVDKGLQDVSSKVRRFASQAASSYFEIKDSVPLLMRRLENETNEKVRYGLEYDLAIIRDGYRIEKQSDGRYSVSVKTKRGIEFLELKKRDLGPKRLKQIIQKVQNGQIDAEGAIFEYDPGKEQ